MHVVIWTAVVLKLGVLKSAVWGKVIEWAWLTIHELDMMIANEYCRSKSDDVMSRAMEQRSIKQ